MDSTLLDEKGAALEVPLDESTGVARDGTSGHPFEHAESNLARAVQASREGAQPRAEDHGDPRTPQSALGERVGEPSGLCGGLAPGRIRHVAVG
jgi:hypothetical protein